MKKIEEMKNKFEQAVRELSIGHHSVGSAIDHIRVSLFGTFQKDCVYCNGTWVVNDNDGVGWECKYCRTTGVLAKGNQSENNLVNNEVVTSEAPSSVEKQLLTLFRYGCDRDTPENITEKVMLLIKPYLSREDSL